MVESHACGLVKIAAPNITTNSFWRCPIKHAVLRVVIGEDGANHLLLPVLESYSTAFILRKGQVTPSTESWPAKDAEQYLQALLKPS